MIPFCQIGHHNTIAWKKQVEKWNLCHINREKDLDQVKTKTCSVEKIFKGIIAHMNWFEEEGASRIKEKLEGTYDMLDQHLFKIDSTDPSKMKVLSSGCESCYASES